MFSSINRVPLRTLTKAAVFSIASTTILYPKRLSFNEASTQRIPRLYQYQICPYCHRVRAYLDFLKIEYEVIEVNPLSKSELNFSKEYKKVPIMEVRETIVNDSEEILNYITKSYNVPSTIVTEDAAEWIRWSEKRLAVLLYPNITRSVTECWECFNYANYIYSWDIFSRLMVRTAGPIAMSFANNRIKKKAGIVDERKELKEVLLEWTAALGEKPFLHGNQITLPDLVVYGVLRAIEDFQTFREIMEENSILKNWYQRVKLSTTSTRL
jgi:microsomal prostaglandin-E synthase 2